MNGNLQSSLLLAATLTFEELGFLFATDELTASQAEAEVEAIARVGFTGPRNGILEVRVTADVLPVLVENMLGSDFSDPQLTLDALGEVANVICGNVVPAVSGSDAVFDLRAPQATAGPGRDLPPLPEPTIRVSLGIEEGRADVALSFENQADE